MGSADTGARGRQPQEEKLDRATVERWRREAVTAPAQDRLWLNRCEALCNALAAGVGVPPDALLAAVPEDTAELRHWLGSQDVVGSTTDCQIARFVWAGLRARETQDSEHSVSAAENAARALVDSVRELDNALAICDAQAQKVNDHPDGDEWVGSYYLRCGLWHRVLGLRQTVASRVRTLKAALAGVGEARPAEPEKKS